MKRFSRLNMVGATHIFILLFVVVAVGIIGSYLIQKGRADIEYPAVRCSAATGRGSTYNGVQKYNCALNNGTPWVISAAGSHIDNLTKGTQWVICQRLGSVTAGAGYNDDWWAWTVGNANHTGWVAGNWGLTSPAGNNNGTTSTNGAFSQVPFCNSSYGPPPITIAYNGGNDGCGSNATHYDTGVHVGTSNYGGVSSYCQCSNDGSHHAYTKYYGPSTSNPSCTGSGGGGSVSGSSHGVAMLNIALAQRGKPYVFGAAGPNSFDCSGLVIYAYHGATGKTMYHQSEYQWAHSSSYGTRILYASQLQPGDIVFFPGSGGSAGNPDHEGIYYGKVNGQYAVVDAYTDGVPLSQQIAIHTFGQESGGFSGAIRIP